MPASSPKVLVAERPPDLDGPALMARGGSDAHLRLAVLLAARLGEADPDARVAMNPQSSWEQRKNAALACAHKSADLTLVDPDALWASPRAAAFDDATSARERRSFLEQLLQVGCDAGWTFLRLDPRPEVSELLENQGLDPLPRTEEEPDAPPALPPVLRPLLRWLLNSGRVSEGFRKLVFASDDPTRTVLVTFVDVIGPRNRNTLARLSLLREEHLLNGVAGPFELGEAPGALPRMAVDHLRPLLHLRNVQQSTRFSVPSPLREHIVAQTTLLENDRVQADRHQLAQRLVATTVPNISGPFQVACDLEAHRLAILSGDEELSLQTARFYGTDLRILARQISRQAQLLSDARATAAYKRAANLYHRIVASFDQDDSYSWHYMAFNQEKSWPQASRHRPPDSEIAEVKGAYEKSCHLSDATAFNPLFHGRRLSFLFRFFGGSEEHYQDLRYRVRHSYTRYGPADTAWLITQVKTTLQGCQNPTGGTAWDRLSDDCPFVRGLKKPPTPRGVAAEEPEL